MASHVLTYCALPASFYESVMAIAVRGSGRLALAVCSLGLLDWWLKLGNFRLYLILAIGVIFYNAMKALYIYTVSRGAWHIERLDKVWAISFEWMFGTTRHEIALSSVVRADIVDSELIILLNDARQIELLHGCAPADVVEAASLFNDAVIKK